MPLIRSRLRSATRANRLKVFLLITLACLCFALALPRRCHDDLVCEAASVLLGCETGDLTEHLSEGPWIRITDLPCDLLDSTAGKLQYLARLADAEVLCILSRR